MSDVNPTSSLGPRRPHGPRHSGDAWVDGEDGRFWGKFGAAGLLVFDPERGVLLQHRVEWSDHGGTWGLPGGALHDGEGAVTGALREAQEEAAVPQSSVVPRFLAVYDVGYWSYTTVVAEATAAFEAKVNDHESISVDWVPVADVEHRALHPGFAASWPGLRASLGVVPRLVVDAANVVGARPDGWWRDRAAAGRRLRASLAATVERGLPGMDLAVDPAFSWVPETILVVEGRARPLADFRVVRVVNAEGSGDDAILEQVASLTQARSDSPVTVVTSDRELAGRIRKAGGHVHGSGWIWREIDRAVAR